MRGAHPRRSSEEERHDAVVAARKSARESLSRTSDAVQAMASQVNAMVLEAENRVRMMELHERLRGLYPGLVSPNRRFVRELRCSVVKHEPSRMLEALAALGEGVGSSPAKSFAKSKSIVGSGGSVYRAPKRKEYTMWLLSDRLLFTRSEALALSSVGHLRLKDDLPMARLRVSWGSRRCQTAALRFQPRRWPSTTRHLSGFCSTRQITLPPPRPAATALP